jgi:hypothetical protein
MSAIPTDPASIAALCVMLCQDREALLQQVDNRERLLASLGKFRGLRTSQLRKMWKRGILNITESAPIGRLESENAAEPADSDLPR